MADPDRFAFYGSGQWTIPEGYLAMKFVKGGLSSNHLDPNARLCMASAVVGFLTTFGVDEPSGCYADLDECDAVLTWGNNWAEMHPVLYSRFVKRKPPEGGGPTLIDLATRRTRSSMAADHYLEFVPQTDLAIANCICHQLLERGSHDQGFVDAHVRFRGDDGADISLAQYRESLADYTPEAVSELSGLSVADLEMLADVFADPARKVVSLWCMGVNQHTRGTAMNNLIPGSTPFSLTGQPSACGTCREVGTLAHALPGGRVVTNAGHRAEVEELWRTRPGAISPDPGFHTVKMFQELGAGGITSMWVQVTNPAQSMPNLAGTLAGAEEAFLVVSDVYPTATTQLADVVLPSAMWVEKNGLFGNSERRTQHWFRMVAPPGEARDDAWQVMAVARRMYELGFEGLKDRDGGFLLAVRDEDGEEVPTWEWDTWRSFNADRPLFEEYRQLSLAKRKDLAPYDAYVEAHGLQWPVVRDEAGQWRETSRRFVEGEDPYVSEGSGVEFYGAKAGDGRAIVWARPYAPPPEVPDEEYPYWLSTGRVLEHWHTGTMTGRCPTLATAMPRAYVELHPDDAADLGVGDGDRLRLTTRRGSLELPVSVAVRAIPARRSVFVPFFDEDARINNLTLDAYDPLSKEPDYKKCAVRLEVIS
jgi:nitrate reductase NapA